jgi:hypothetical protein
MMTRSLVFLVLTVVVLAGGAFFYIQQRFSDSVQLNRVSSLDEIRGKSPTICSYEESDSRDTSTGVMRVYDDRLRIDMNVVGSLYTGELKVVIDRDGRYHWADPYIESTWPAGVSSRQTVDDVLFASKWRCFPWWFPSEILFDIETNG